MKYLFIIIIVTINLTLSETKLNKTILYKCCSMNQYINKKIKKMCIDLPSDKQFNFSRILIYNKNYEMKRIYKTINSVFNIVPNKFHLDKEFHDKAEGSRSWALREYNIYLTENATLYLEKPNTYKRWDTTINQNNYCFDFFMKNDRQLIPMFWVSPHNVSEATNDDFLTAAMFVSCFFLLLVLIVYALLPEMRNLCGLILMACVTSLLAAFLLLGVIRIKNYTSNVCYRLTLVIYYSFLASFCWMNVMSYDIWWTFRTMYYAKARPMYRREKVVKYLIYSIYAWGLPLALTIMMALIDTANLKDKPWFVKPNLKHECFIQGGEKLYYLYMPMLILICANWMFYLMTAFNIWRLSSSISVLDLAAAGTPATHLQHRQRFFVYMKLSIVMGLSWIFEVFQFLVPNVKIWYLTDLFNILTGILIFVIFVCKRKIIKKLVELFFHHYRSKKQWYTGTTATSIDNDTNSSESNQETQTLQVCANPNGPNL